MIWSDNGEEFFVNVVVREIVGMWRWLVCFLVFDGMIVVLEWRKIV